MCVIAVPTKQHLTGFVAETLGRDLSSGLHAAGHGTLTSGVHAELLVEETETVTGGFPTRPATRWDGPLLALYPTRLLFHRIDDLLNIGSILVVPWVLSELEHWARTWQAQPLDGTGRKFEPYNVSPLVDAVMRSLSGQLNLSDPLSMEKNLGPAVSAFDILHDAGEPFERNAVRAWFLRNIFCQPQYADDIGTVAARVLDRETFVPRTRAWRNDILEQWRSEAATHGDDSRTPA